MEEKSGRTWVNEPFCVIVPCFNEKGNLGPLTDSMLRVFDEFNLPGRILIINDGSTDGTGELADELAMKHGRIKVLHQPVNRGMARSLSLAFSEVEEEVLITTDADQSMDPAYIPALLEKLDDFDLVIASRHVKGGRIEGFPAYRIAGSKMVNAIASSILGLDIRDITCGYRAYKKKYLKGASFSEANMASFQVEILGQAIKNGARVMEVPIIEKPRAHGKSKFRLAVEITSFIRLLLKQRFS